MKFNLITAFLDDKIARLSKMGMLFYPEYYFQDFLLSHFKCYFENYVNFHFYDKFDTLDKKEYDDITTLKREFDGKRLEMLYDYSSNELLLSNEEYSRNVSIINEMYDISMFIVFVDELHINDENEIYNEVVKILDEFPKVKNNLGNNLDKFVEMVTEKYNFEKKIFNDVNPNFYVDYTYILKQNELIYSKLEYSYRSFKIEFNRNLVDRIYKNDDFILRKTQILFYKLSREILAKTLANVHIEDCIVDINESLFKNGSFLMEESIDNYVLKKHVILGISLDSYLSHKEFFDTFGYKCACVDDLSTVDDPIGRLKMIKDLKFFKCVIVTNYANDDYDQINNYKDIELFITRSE